MVSDDNDSPSGRVSDNLHDHAFECGRNAAQWKFNGFIMQTPYYRSLWTLLLDQLIFNQLTHH